MCRVSKFCLNSQDMFVCALKWMKWVYVRALGQLDTSKAALKARRLPPSATPPAFQPWNQEEEDVDHAICEEGIIETNCFCCFHLRLSGKNSDKAIFTLFSGPFIGGYQNLTLTPPPSHRIFVAEIEEKYKYALYVAVVPSCQMTLHSLTCERRQFRLLRQCSALLWTPAAQMMLRWAEGERDNKRK